LNRPHYLKKDQNMLKKLNKSIAVTALIVSGFAGLSANAQGISLTVVDGQATVTPLSATPAVLAVRGFAPAAVTPLTNLDCSVFGRSAARPVDIKLDLAKPVVAEPAMLRTMPVSGFDPRLALTAFRANPAAFLSAMLPATAPCAAVTR
jgi:hypothetical protein